MRFFLCALTILTSCAAAAPEEDDRVRSALPAGWSVERKGDSLVVTRDREVWFYNGINLPNLDAKQFDAHVKAYGRLARFAITLRLAPRMSLEEFAEKKRENARLDRDLAALAEKIRTVPHKFDQYLPSTPEEKKLVEEYENAKRNREGRELPQGYFDAHSVYFSSVDSPANLPYPAEAARECFEVKKRMVALFTPYPD